MSKQSPNPRYIRAPSATVEDAGCELCRRQPPSYTRHHLVPRAKGGRFGPTVYLCPTCHHQIHALFSEETLARELHSIELIRANTQIARYLSWVQRQSGQTSFRVHRSNHRR